jgi:hypothetical protein
MNQLQKTFLAGFAGTTVMTSTSALMSEIMKQNFREPEHLETMIGRLLPQLAGHAKKIAGWGAHYAMGFIFAAIYVELWERRKIRHSIKNGIIIGAISGLLGYMVWKGTFKAHPLPPWLNYRHFYIQRIPAHIIFAVFATLAYRLTISPKKKI